MRYPLTVVLLVTLSLIAKGQSSDTEEIDTEEIDIEEIDTKPVFTPGLYLSFYNFIENDPVLPEDIITNIPRQRDFYIQLFRANAIDIALSDSMLHLHPEDVWGYSDGRGIFINRSKFPTDFLVGADVSENPFAQINIMGTLCLVYYLKTHSSSALTGNRVMVRANDVRQSAAKFILNTKDGSFHKATLPQLEEMIADDPALLKEFSAYRGKRSIKLYVFLKKYNEKHPAALGY